MDNKPRQIKITWKQFKEWKEADIQRAIREGVDLGGLDVENFIVYGVQQGIKLTFNFGIFRNREKIKEADEKCNRLIEPDKFPTFKTLELTEVTPGLLKKLRQAMKNTKFKLKLSKMFFVGPKKEAKKIIKALAKLAKKQSKSLPEEEA